MMQLWIGAALLAGSWLLGVNYFSPAAPLAWLIVVGAGVLLLSRGRRMLAGFGSEDDSHFVNSQPWLEPLITIVLLLPAVWFAPWPYRAAPLLIVLGLGLRLLPLPRPWLRTLSHGLVAAGVVLFVQGLALAAYASQTARAHDLPWPLPDLLATVAGFLGIEAAVNGADIAMHSMRQVHRLAATWELLFDPATFCFYAGSLTMLAITLRDVLPAGQRWLAWIRGLRTLTLVILAWLPLRAGLLMAVYLQRVLRSDAEQPLHVMNHFFSPWVLLALLIVPVLLAWRFVRWPNAQEPASGEPQPQGAETLVPSAIADPFALPTDSHTPWAARGFLRAPIPFPVTVFLVAAGIALLTMAIAWDPVGARKAGRVMVVERHSTWEPTTKPYDTTWYGEDSGYNYAAIYDYLGQYFQMSRLLESAKIDDQTLDGCDVLVIKTPTTRYQPAEVQAVQRFVKQGGGLLLVGDHTNFEGMSTTMNDIVRPMGFLFRNDLLFSFEESPYDEWYERAPVPHPAVQHVPGMDFAVSCSIDPGNSRGRPAIIGTRLWSMGPDYHMENFHPIPQHCPEMRYGAFIQAWAARFGQGRALAFTDSTVFSNFCVFQPGKAELMLDMVEWLNHANPPCNPRPWLLLLGMPLLAAGVWFARGRSWLLLLAAGTCGWVVACGVTNVLHARAMPLPKCQRPLMRVVIDRTTSSALLSKGAYIVGNGKGYGLLEQWIARLGCYTVRQAGAEAFSGAALVVICPSRAVSQPFRERLMRYVADGGKLVVIDSPEKSGSTANSLLWPFGLAMHHNQSAQGTLTLDGKSTKVKVEKACEVAGGQPVAQLARRVVASMATSGKGAVLAIGFGSLWNDTNMGETWMLEPEPAVQARYDALFTILRPFLENEPAQKGTTPKSTKPANTEDLPMKESGPADF